MVMDKIALALLIVGGLNWGCIGLFQFDLVAFACGGSASLISRIIYTVVGLTTCSDSKLLDSRVSIFLKWTSLLP